MFDYFYYRLYLLYNEKEKGSNADSSAACALSAIQIIMLFSFYLLINFVTDWKFDLRKYKDNKDIAMIIGGVFAAFLGWLNYKYYKKRRPKLLKKYAQAKANKWFRCWMLYLFALFSLTIPFIVMFVLAAFGLL